MTTTILPPTPVPPAPQGEPTPPPPRSTSSRVIAILAIVFGALAIVGTMGSAAWATVASASIRTGTNATAVSGVTNIDAELAAGSLTIEFADIDEAELTVTGTSGADRWVLERDGDTLEVRSRDRLWGEMWFWGGSAGEAELRLPRDLAGVDADVSVAAGSFEASGDFGDLTIDLGAGRIAVEGSATALTLEVAAGRGEVDLDGVDTAELSVSAGTLSVGLTGTQPSEIVADVSAGSLTLAVPEGRYEVTSDVSGGSFDDRIGSTPGARSTIDVEVSAGQAVLRPSR
ncbi:DUF4097 domain-containing protein [Microbacterium lacus]|uniref:DUF4097 family beta strand repeat-containing protein n=1 Tax=Microbacterium lacus TaxID=415217 RepID=UPI00384A763F